MKRRRRNGSEKFENKITFTSMLRDVRQQTVKRNRIRGPLNLDHRGRDKSFLLSVAKNNTSSTCYDEQFTSPPT